MTVEIVAKDVARLINDHISEAVVSYTETDLLVKLEYLGPVARFLKEEPGLDFSFLIGITAVDYVEYFELIYHLRSMKLNQSVVLKARAFGRDEPIVPSLVELWPGADLQEREIWDLMGIKFDAHPNLKRILLWEGFSGHPLRKDYLG
ncbi:MAG: NADH-quinone oxidoreductase subunit C [Chloroflexota bacterium]|nr:NADH-quinone oxidoreductase subunit C [Chloroflexota bacterium]